MPKKSAPKKTATRKASAERASNAESPMRKVERAVGPNTDGLTDSARAAHAQPVVPTDGEQASSAPDMNTPPSSSPDASAVDEGQRS